MAKKSRRARRRASAAAQPVRISDRGQTEARKSKVKEIDFAKEYHYVIEDLKRLAITGAGLFVVLFALAIVLT
jgi:hypothetical protein